MPMPATTIPAITPTSAASATRLDSRARTTARSRRGISSWVAILAIKMLTGRMNEIENWVQRPMSAVDVQG